jgi:hypothetical protein
MRTLLVCLAACSLVHASEIRAGLEPQSVRKTAQDFVLLGCVRQVGLAVQLQGQAPWTFGPLSAVAVSRKFHHSSKFTTPTPVEGLPWLASPWTFSMKI